MKDFKTFLAEAGNTPIEVTWDKTDSKWFGEFSIDDVVFEINIHKDNDYCDDVDIYEFKFTRNGRTNLVNDYKYPFTVVPTIQKAMGDFLTEVEPDIIGFVGNKDDKGRVKMYEKNAKIFSDKFDYRLFLDNSSDYYAYVLYRDEDFKDCVKRLMESK